MIILPAIPAIIAALTPLAKAALVSAGIGAAVGGATCAATGAVRSYHVLGEFNRQVVVEAVQNVPKCAAEGALVGGAFGGAGFMFAPVVTPAITPVTQFADDAAKYAITAIDDAAQPAMQVIDDVVRPGMQTADDAAAPVLIGLDDAANSTKTSASRITGAIASPWNRALNSFRARIYKRLPITKVGADDGWVYVIEDPVTGIRKIGRTSNPEQRLTKLQRDLGHKGVKFDCIIHSHDAKALEKHLHQSFSRQGTLHPTPHNGATEWFALSAAQVATACSF